jgi:hypothetical protein
MTDAERGLDIYFAQRITIAVYTRTRSTVRRLGRLRAAAHNFGEYACEAETNGRHAYADYAYLPLNYGPERGFQVVPGHVCCVGEVDEGTEADDRYDSHADGQLALLFCVTSNATHKVPTPNISNTPIFFRMESFKFQICGIGSDKVTKSRSTLNAACANASELLFKHRPVCSPSHCNQAKFTGVQTKTAAKKNATMAAPLQMITLQTRRRKCLAGKICR